ncbi:hypothetical protein GUJ93_ZPchr0013g37956 [Zizania palustris]|uniref:Uncharacterized protein n=1 Tax=Zizania palustris TaxID=103762 RepID=A0A8J5WVQ5_ZIZPA|nr:hypothetical protein GUJ93_ZPchr0013g37956 [Zizania palustris]
MERGRWRSGKAIRGDRVSAGGRRRGKQKAIAGKKEGGDPLPSEMKLLTGGLHLSVGERENERRQAGPGDQRARNGHEGLTGGPGGNGAGEERGDASADRHRAASQSRTAFALSPMESKKAARRWSSWSAGPSAPVDGAALGKPAILVVGNLNAARPEKLYVPLYDELVVQSGIKVGCDEFEASEPGVLVVILLFPIFVAAAHVASILLGVSALVISV